VDEADFQKAVDAGTDLGPGVTPKDMVVIRALQSRYTNRVFIQITGANLRVNLGEVISGETVYHTALIMSASEAIGYADLLTEMAERAVKQQRELDRDGE